MKRILLVFLLCIAPLAMAQNFENLWEDHFSYVSVKDISQGDDRIFVGTDNAIFIYDLSTEEITTFIKCSGPCGRTYNNDTLQ